MRPRNGNLVYPLVTGVVLLSLAFTDVAFASFGITPPYVRNTSLTRNSSYEQQILLVRGDPKTPQKAEIVVDAPEIQDWIELVQGPEIKLPRGEQKIPMTVRVNVPSDAEFKNYTGTIRIKTLPDGDGLAAGAVNISLGAIVDIDLTVIDKVIKDFRVRRIGVSDLNEGRKLGWLYFPGKIKFDMTIENTGNVDVAPSKVEFRIFDRTGRTLLEETENLGKISTVKPYATEKITAEIPTRLPSGSYLARYTIYNEDSIRQQGELNLSIRPYGTLQEAGFGFMGLSMAHKVSVLLPIFSVLIVLLYIAYGWQQRYKRKRLKLDE